MEHLGCSYNVKPLGLLGLCLSCVVLPLFGWSKMGQNPRKFSNWDVVDVHKVFPQSKKKSLDSQCHVLQEIQIGLDHAAFE